MTECKQHRFFGVKKAILKDHPYFKFAQKHTLETTWRAPSRAHLGAPNSVVHHCSTSILPGLFHQGNRTLLWRSAGQWHGLDWTANVRRRFEVVWVPPAYED